MTLQQLRYFNAIVHTGGLARAAEQLFVSQPSLSIAIANLEKELGIALFARQGRSVRLTPEGEAFVPHVERILQAVEEAKIHMNSLSEQSSHCLRLGYVSPLATHYVPSLLHNFLQISGNENTSLEFECGTTRELVRKLKNGVYDLLLCSYPGDDPALRMTVLFEQPLELLSPTATPVEVQSLQELELLPLIGYPSGGAMDSHLAMVQRRESLHLRFICRAPDEEAIAGLCENRFGCAVVAAVDNLSNVSVHRQRLPGGYARKIYCVTFSERRYYGVAKRFINYVFSGEGKTPSPAARSTDTQNDML